MKYKNYNNSILIIFFLIFCNCSLINSQNSIEFKYYDGSTNSTFIRYPQNPTITTCTFSFNFWVIRGDGVFIKSISSSSGGSFTSYGSNSTHSLYWTVFSYSQSTSTYQNTITVTTNDDLEYGLINVCECGYLSNISSQIDVEIVGDIIFNPILGYSLIYRTMGFPTYYEPSVFYNLVQITAIKLVGDYGLAIINYNRMSISNYDSDLTAPFQLCFFFGSFWINKTVSSYYENYTDPNLKLSYYPIESEWDALFEPMGNGYLPVFTITTKTEPKVPFFSLVYQNLFTPALRYIPIYEDVNNGITTYMASPKSLNLDIGATNPNYQFYVQNINKPLLEFNKTLNIINLPITILRSFNLTSIEDLQVPLVICDFNSMEDSYHLNTFRFTLIYQNSDVKAPFGFYSGTNSAFKYIIELPISPYNPSVSFGLYNPLAYTSTPTTITNSLNTNEPDDKAPEIINYEFIYLTNSKYIFKVEITDDFCGFGTFSFDAVGYYEASKYRSSGDKLSGIYEIPIDFDLDLVFIQVNFNDLCGNANYILFDQVYNFSPTLFFNKFIVPFYSNKQYNTYDIQNISYLYNNLDVTSHSVGNIVYFTLEGAEPTTPLGIRLPEISYVDFNPFFVNEYYASWNSTINKFQIEFIVPKNSRLGPYIFSFMVMSQDSINSATPSDFFPISSQLIISKSNFDGIGPIFSKVEKIPFNNGKFGWSLTISDPINGFDNGTITVTGSEDNSIYKFDLFPTNRTSGNSTQGIYEIIIDLGSNYCIYQDYIITFVKLWDTGAQFTVFEFTTTTPIQYPNPLVNPFYLYSNDSTINKQSISECTSSQQDLSPPYLNSFIASRQSIDVGSNDRSISFEFEVEDPDSGIKTNSQGPIIYITAQGFYMIQCISTFKSNTTATNAIFECTTELPIGFGSSFEVIYFSVFGIINNHGIYSGLSTQMLISLSQSYKVDVTYSLSSPLLLESSKIFSKGGEYFVYGRSLSDVTTLIITDTVTHQNTEYTNIKLYGTSSISIPNLSPITNKFYVSLKTNQGTITNKLLVSPVLFLYPIDSSSSISSSSSNSESTPLPTNSPQQCSGSPICGGPTHGICNTQTGCICIYPWKGKSCQDKVIEPEQPVVDPNEPSTGINIPDDTDDNGNPINNIHYKSLISLYSLREVDINGNTVKNYKFNDNWEFNQISTLISNYKTNVTTIDNSFNTTISTTLEWFNQSKVITFADQDLEMNANSIKYSIEISKYPFTNSLNYLQLVMSATLTSTSSTSCSSKDFGDTTTGDNSNYINIQIDNKSLYGRFIKRGIVDNNKVVALSNEILDSQLNAISTPSQSQRYVGITIPQFKERAIIDPDFSVLLNSDSASSKSNSVCKSKGLSGAKIAGIVIGSVAFVSIIVISVIYHFKKKREGQKFESSITNKLKEMNNNT